jgi:hypothetical protein
MACAAPMRMKMGSRGGVMGNPGSRWLAVLSYRTANVTVLLTAPPITI